MSAASTPASDTWYHRVFRNTFTRAGRVFRVKRWSVKLQHDGVRRTISLQSPQRAEAGREARAIALAVRTLGWQALTEARAPASASAAPRSAPRSPGVIRGLPRAQTAADPRFEPTYWRQRLVQRNYMEPAKPGSTGEFSARIECDGAYQYFPLGTRDERVAAAQAAEIYRTVAVEGWTVARARFAREFTVAIYWAESPSACTYTTLFTFWPRDRQAIPPRCTAKCVSVLEPEPAVAETFAYWLRRQPGFDGACGFTNDTQLAAASVTSPDLILVNRAQPDTSASECVRRLAARCPAVPILTYGVYEDSDQIFASTSGVAAGYIFRRRLPAGLFEPIEKSAGYRRLTRDGLARQVRDYFQNFFSNAVPSPGDPPPTQFTHREQEIMSYLSRGFVDKEIARALDISPWTVHNHLKNIYDKLDVHTRTEAVVKYLQK